jgi:hypothetical protein
MIIPHRSIIDARTFVPDITLRSILISWTAVFGVHFDDSSNDTSAAFQILGSPKLKERFTRKEKSRRTHARSIHTDVPKRVCTFALPMLIISSHQASASDAKNRQHSANLIESDLISERFDRLALIDWRESLTRSFNLAFREIQRGANSHRRAPNCNHCCTCARHTAGHSQI